MLNLDNLFRNLDQNNFSEENTALVPGANHSLAINQIFALFEQIYQSAPRTLKTSSGYEFSLTVKKSEDYLIEAERISTNNPEIKDQIVKMKGQLQELIKMIPSGPCVLLQRDIDKINQFSKVSTNEKYKSRYGEFYEPKVSLLEIASYFQGFCEKNGFPGTSIAMKRENFYGGYENGMMTLVGFKLKEITFPKIFSVRAYLNLQPKEDVNRLENILKKLALEKFKDWGFDNFEVVFTETAQVNVKQKIQEENKYRCFIIFFHKKVELEEQKRTTITTLVKNQDIGTEKDLLKN